nr:nucleoside-diphosphate sugar epimerase/dehydratase [Shimia abyssi]
MILIVVDLLLLPIAFVGALAVQRNTFPDYTVLREWSLLLVALCSTAFVFSWALGISRIRLSAYDIHGVWQTALFATLLGVAGAGLSVVFTVSFPGSFFVLFALVYFLTCATARIAMLQILLTIYRRAHTRCRVVIYGAGTTGIQLASALKTHEAIEAVAFVEDNPRLVGTRAAGLSVYPGFKLPDIIEKNEVHRVLLAMPSLSMPKQLQIAKHIETLGVEVQTLPSFSQLVGEEPLVNRLQNISPAAFLGRTHLSQNAPDLTNAYTHRVILISGAGGSIGCELSRQILAARPKRLVLFELNELALYNIEKELSALARDLDVDLIPILGSVTDARLVANVLKTNNVEIVLHAAAYKHVPLVEKNPLAGMANNVLGTHSLAREAMAAGVAKFILISTDKAVRPSNFMGASKRLAEMVVLDQASRSTVCVFSVVRFGNVLGSSGSVIPLFQEQIARGGPLTLTHRDTTRYFMTAQEAVQLVLHAGTFASGGEIFVLDMGKPMPIYDLARQIIEANGYTVRDSANPNGDIEIEIAGLRPGEKLHEELITNTPLQPTQHPKIMIAVDVGLPEIHVAAVIRAIRTAVASGDKKACTDIAVRWVDGYKRDRLQAKAFGLTTQVFGSTTQSD